jgi:hypothetical protein
MNPNYPEKLYCYLDEDDKLALSVDKPDGEWAIYEHKQSCISSAEYYELEKYSKWPLATIHHAAPQYFYAETNTAGDYFIL